MQFKALIFAAVASVAVAQSATSTACAGQNILESCLGTIQGQVNACSTNDFSCLCSTYTSMLTCYASCPNDPRVGTAQQQKQLNCANASVYGTTSTVVSAAATGGSSATATMSSSGSATRSSSAASASSTKANGADNIKAASGLLAFAAVGAVAFL